ncbi:bromodomain-containing protein [Fragilaria crotonensis]|nr:bromodomain-containing protein [Fragilaria crotonensis]
MSTASSTAVVDEEDLRKELRELLQKVTRREPLETTYKYLLLNGVVTPRKPVIPNYKMYTKAMKGSLRERLESFGQVHEWDRIAQRQHDQWDESSLRAAFTLREPKKHETEALLQATLTARNTRHVVAREAYVEAMALGLQSKELKLLKQREESRQMSQKKLEQQQEQERASRLEQQHRNREANRRRRNSKRKKRRKKNGEKKLDGAKKRTLPGEKLQSLSCQCFRICGIWSSRIWETPIHSVLSLTSLIALPWVFLTIATLLRTR